MSASPYIDCPDVTMGRGVSVHPSAKIACKKLVIGDYVEIGADFRADCGEITIGDYSRIYESCLFYGKEPISIGHNFFLGGHSILNSYARLSIGKGVGIGAYSQVWTHASWGEEIEGCLLNQVAPTTIQDHAWLIGHVIVGAGVTVGAQAVVLSGAMVSKTVEAAKTYGGVPAHDRTHPLHPPYKTLSLEEKWEILKRICAEFMETRGAKMSVGLEGIISITRDNEAPLLFHKRRPEWKDLPKMGGFFLNTKTYAKRHLPLEIEFMQFCRGGKARFYPE